MAKATSGPAPWTSGYKALRKAASSRGYIPGKGYRKHDGVHDWRKLPQRTATKRIINPLTGRAVNVPTTDMQDYWNAYISYTQTGSPDDDVMQFTAERGLDIEGGMAAYAEEAFDDKHKHYTIEGCGHIQLLEYNVRRQVMRVTFLNGGAVVVYFRIPSSLFGELYAHAESKKESTNTFDGKSRHLLGIRFWDLVRIRGTRTGSRYRFTYVTGNASTGNMVGRPEAKGSWDEKTEQSALAQSEQARVNNRENWKDWTYSANNIEDLFPSDEPDWANIPYGDEAKDPFGWMWHHNGEEQKKVIKDCTRLVLSADYDLANIAYQMIRHNVVAPDPNAERHAGTMADFEKD